MQFPRLTDVIVAVASQWRASPVGIVRLSGQDAFAHAAALGLTPPVARGSCWTEGSMRFTTANAREPAEYVLPVTAFWFRAPRSYTGQDVVELHTVGNRPLLGELCAWLVNRGARRALPGEFTARAYLNGRMGRGQVAGVLNLIQAEDVAGLRAAAREVTGAEVSWREELAARTTRLLALIEAGIDFVDEEDVQILTPGQAATALDELLAMLERRLGDTGSSRRAGIPHVVLAGLPNAGKSTLFNALLGARRAIVSPVPGTTRDVLSAEVRFDAAAAILQDSAGRGGAADELAQATHAAAEGSAEQADLVLWVHALPAPWTAEERAACSALPRERRMLIGSKSDLVHAPFEPVGPDPAPDVCVSALTQAGLADLRRLLAERLCALRVAPAEVGQRGELVAVREALGRARALVGPDDGRLAAADLIALELREALARISPLRAVAVDEAVLEHIFRTFCVGK